MTSQMLVDDSRLHYMVAAESPVPISILWYGAESQAEVLAARDYEFWKGSKKAKVGDFVFISIVDGSEVRGGMIACISRGNSEA